MSKPIQTVQELDAVLHWRRKHALAIKERDALQALLTVRDERWDELVSAVRSINYGPAHKITVPSDDEPQYRQRKEWIEWVLGLCDTPLKPASQPQGEPVARIDGMYGDPEAFAEREIRALCDVNKLKIGTLLYAEQPSPVAVVPDGYCIMPRQLTAENGAKALMLGEFKLLVTKECPECCELEEPTEGCSICDGEGEYGQKHTIPWDQIKFIYSKAVSGLAVKDETTKSR